MLVHPSKDADIIGTSLMGYVTTSYARLVELFGEPNCDGDGYKVDAEWTLRTPAGVATIYNYKDGPNYNEGGGTPVEDITNWHVGGRGIVVVEWVQKAIDGELE